MVCVCAFLSSKISPAHESKIAMIESNRILRPLQKENIGYSTEVFVTRCLTRWRPIRVSRTVNPGGPQGVFTGRGAFTWAVQSNGWRWDKPKFRCVPSIGLVYPGMPTADRRRNGGGGWWWNTVAAAVGIRARRASRSNTPHSPVRRVRACTPLPSAAEVRSEDVVNEKVCGSVRVVRSRRRGQRNGVIFTLIPLLFHNSWYSLQRLGCNRLCSKYTERQDNVI